MEFVSSFIFIGGKISFGLEKGESLRLQDDCVILFFGTRLGALAVHGAYYVHSSLMELMAAL